MTSTMDYLRQDDPRHPSQEVLEAAAKVSIWFSMHDAKYLGGCANRKIAEQDALDAARYRVLRDPLCNHGVLPTGRKLDDYCDAAISAEKKENQE